MLVRKTPDHWKDPVHSTAAPVEVLSVDLLWRLSPHNRVQLHTHPFPPAMPNVPRLRVEKVLMRPILATREKAAGLCLATASFHIAPVHSPLVWPLPQERYPGRCRRRAAATPPPDNAPIVDRVLGHFWPQSIHNQSNSNDQLRSLYLRLDYLLSIACRGRGQFNFNS